MNRAQIVNEVTLINNDYNAVYWRLSLLLDRKPSKVIETSAEAMRTRLKAQWDRFNNHIDSKDEFDYPKLLEYRAELQGRCERAKAWIDKHMPPSPKREVTDITDIVYGRAKPKRKKK